MLVPRNQQSRVAATSREPVSLVTSAQSFHDNERNEGAVLTTGENGMFVHLAVITGPVRKRELLLQVSRDLTAVPTPSMR